MALVPAPHGRRRRSWLRVVVVAVLVWWGLGVAAAAIATAPRCAPIPALPASLEPGETVTTRTADGVSLRGWFVAGREPSTCVVLAAGIGGNRTAMVARATFHRARGASVLLVDLRGTGASDPERISMGWHEALDLVAWHAFLRERGVTSIGVHGQSLGAAAAVYTAVRGGPEWRFVVLESCYVDIHEALAGRLPWLPSFSLWPMVCSAEWFIGVAAGELAPERAIAALRAPTLLVQGERDPKVGARALERLFAASGAVHKATCVVPHAGHEDLWGHGGRVPAAIMAFLLPR